MNDILDRLRSIIVSRHGEEGVTPEEWSGVLSTCIDAAEEIRRSRAFIASLRPELARINESMDRTIAANKLVAAILNGDHTNG